MTPPMPERVAALVAEGHALMRQGGFADAQARYRAALSLAPDSAELVFTLGTALLASGRVVCAEKRFREALAHQPGHAAAHHNLGATLRLQNRPSAAIDSYQQALALRPDDFRTSNDLGAALLALHRPAEAIPYFQATLAHQPDHAEACNNLGGALLALNRAGDAIPWFRRAARLDVDLPDARLGEALALLSLGDFAAGWRAYEARWRDPRMQAMRPATDRPDWRGDSDIAGRTILLHGEQGFGDMIQFVRYAPLLRQRGARVVLSVPANLVALCRNLADHVIATGTELPPHDLICPLMSLPLAFATTPETVPADIPYLHASPKPLGPHTGRRIGIAWSGSADHPDDTLRSVDLSLLLDALRRAGAELYVVQTEIDGADRAVLAAHPQIHAPPISDFADTASVLAALDLVISVDTAVAHLAGAMGIPVWLLVQWNPDFRWLYDRLDTPWYPTMRLFRQKRAKEWGDVLEDVKEAVLF